MSMMMMMMIMVMNCFCGMVDQRKAFSFISSHEHCQRSSPLQMSDTLQAGFQPVQNLNLGFDEWSCAVVITTTLENSQQPQKLTWNTLSPETHLQSDLTFFLCCKKMFSICGKATWWENFCFQETKDPLKIFDQPRQLWNVIPGTILQSSEWHQPVHKLHDNRYPCFWGCQLINGKLYPWWIELLEASSVCREFVKCNCIKFCTGICIRFKTDLQWTELCYCLGPCPYSKS